MKLLSFSISSATCVFALLLATAGAAVAQQRDPVDPNRPDSPPRPGTRPPGGGEPGRPGPWDHDVVLQTISNGEGGTTASIGQFERAGVPTLARLGDGRLMAAYQCFPENDPPAFDKVAVRFSSDDGHRWTPPDVIRLEGWPTEMRFPFDPTLVALPDGKVRLYFTALGGRRFTEGTPTIGSAISTNGIDFAVEPGTRFAVEGRPVIDCAVVLHRGEFHLFAPDNGRGGPPPDPGQDARPDENRPRDGVAYHAISRDGLIFERAEDLRMPPRHRWLGNAQSDGQLISFFGTGDRGIWTATSADGLKWSEPRTLAGVRGADPGAVRQRDGSWLIAATGPPRQGTASEQQRFRRNDNMNRPPRDRVDPPRGWAPRTLRDIAYVSDGHERQTLDLYLPGGGDGERRPLIIWIHGGAWTGGNKDSTPAERFVPLGFAVASVNYRLSQHAIFPAQLEDCKAAVRWLRAHAEEYGLDETRFAAWGSSAGGHLVALLGTTGDTKEFDVGSFLERSSRVRCVVDFFGPTDFLQMDAHRLPNGMVHNVADSPESRLVGGLITAQTNRVARANPITYVNAGDAPFLIVHGDQDPLVPHHQSEMLQAALMKANVPIQFYTVRDGGHGGFRDSNVEDLVTGFLMRQLGRKRPTSP